MSASKELFQEMQYRVEPQFIVREGLIEALSAAQAEICLLYTSPSPRDRTRSRMPSSA